MSLHHFVGSAYFDAWGWFVGVGLAALSLGILAWDVACARLVLAGYRVQGTLLAVAGTAMGVGQVVGAVFLDLVLPYRMGQTVAVVAGIRVRRPELLLLPDSALTWVIAGVAMAVMGAGMLAIRHRVPEDEEAAD